jgi:hypothetical protein
VKVNIGVFALEHEPAHFTVTTAIFHTLKSGGQVQGGQLEIGRAHV